MAIRRNRARGLPGPDRGDDRVRPAPHHLPNFTCLPSLTCFPSLTCLPRRTCLPREVLLALDTPAAALVDFFAPGAWGLTFFSATCLTSPRLELWKCIVAHGRPWFCVGCHERGGVLRHSSDVTSITPARAGLSRAPADPAGRDEGCTPRRTARPRPPAPSSRRSS